jgi:hypothetical protein
MTLLILTLVGVGPPLATGQEITLGGRGYTVGCNGSTTGLGPDVRRNELVNWVLRWTADGDDFENVRVEIEPEDAFTSSRVTVGNGSTGATGEGVVGDLADTTSGRSRHYWTWTSGTQCSVGSPFRFKATVYYIDSDGDPDPPFVYDSRDSSLLAFSACDNSSVTAVEFPPEVCHLELATVGTGVLFKWSRMNDTDVYNLYRGEYPPVWDDTDPTPRVAFDHIGDPNVSIGFCTEAGTLTSGSITCGCDDCHTETATHHREYLDSDEPGGDLYYVLSGEVNCEHASAGAGVEGTLGTDSFGNERPYGGGECPPMS